MVKKKGYLYWSAAKSKISNEVAQHSFEFETSRGTNYTVNENYFHWRKINLEKRTKLCNLLGTLLSNISRSTACVSSGVDTHILHACVHFVYICLHTSLLCLRCPRTVSSLVFSERGVEFQSRASHRD